MMTLALALGLAGALGAQPALRLTLADSEQSALGASHDLKAAQAEADAAQAHADSLKTALYPRLALDGRWGDISHVPTADFFGKQLPMSDYYSYSYGASATWDLLSLGAAYPNWKAAQAQVDARKQAVDLAGQQLRLQVRLAYFETQLAATQQRLYADALKLAQSTDQDLALRLKAGSSSRIDALSASNDELERRSAYRISQAELARSLRALFALTGQADGADLSLPVDDAVGRSLPAKVADPTIVVKLDDSSALLAALASAEKAQFNAQGRPQWLQMQAMVDQAQRQVDAAWAGHLPLGSVSYRFSHDYPDGMNFVDVNQQTLGANVSVPIYAFGQVSRRVDEQKGLASAAAERRDQSATDLETAYLSARDRLAGLKDQRDLQTQAAQQADELQQLVYGSYKVGGSTYLEVQTSSLGALQAKLALAITEAQMQIELANLAALTDPTH
jgi:outer membrane protein TolC